MTATRGNTASLPARAGIGLKAEHYREILDDRPDVGFFEVHAENYMGSGGPPHRYLEAIRRDYPLSLHGVGLSIGAARPLDRDHLARLKILVDRYEPASFSEHLAWSTHDTAFLNDLLPLPLTEETLTTVAAHVDEVQDRIGRRILLENPSSYLVFAESTIPEPEFLTEVSRRTGCGLLLDVNNVFVSAVNLQTDPLDYIEAFALDRVGEIHLAGFAETVDDRGDRLLIDAHGTPTAVEVLALYKETIRRVGRVPTLVEWDNDVPDLRILLREAGRAEAATEEALESATRHRAADREFAHAIAR